MCLSVHVAIDTVSKIENCAFFDHPIKSLDSPPHISMPARNSGYFLSQNLID